MCLTVGVWGNEHLLQVCLDVGHVVWGEPPLPIGWHENLSVGIVPSARCHLGRREARCRDGACCHPLWKLLRNHLQAWGAVECDIECDTDSKASTWAITCPQYNINWPPDSMKRFWKPRSHMAVAAWAAILSSSSYTMMILPETFFYIKSRLMGSQYNSEANKWILKHVQYMDILLVCFGPFQIAW